ncbi:MAG TPA: HNH endonuclease [Pyrinomonadaceae bacterium]|nr:HNH endonuclease [Pyrinomonadaceae bacterium]
MKTTDAGGGSRAREPLTVELVPRSAWFKNVRSHVSREEWERLKRITFGRAGYACEVCGGRGARWPVECHEVFAYDDERRVQKLLRLVALCPRCHEVKHIGLAGVRGRRREAVAHLARVNGWSEEDAETYLEVCFETWHRRSCHEWRLDLSLLEQFGIRVEERR